MPFAMTSHAAPALAALALLVSAHAAGPPVSASTPLALDPSSPGTPASGEEQFGNAPVPANDEWSPGVLAVANDPHRVYRRWVNGNEEFFFAGDTEAVESALARFAAIEAEVREVVLMPNAGRTRSFEDREVAFGWRLYAPSGICLAMSRATAMPAYPPHATLTVHAGGDVDLAKLSIPPGVTLLGPEDLAHRYRSAASATRDEHARTTLEHALEQLAPIVEPEDAAAARRLEAVNELLHAARGVSLELAFDEEEGLLSASLVNRRKTPVTLVLPGDGSELGARTPEVRWSIRDAETGEPRPAGWIGCGNIDPMRADEVVTLAPGERRATTVLRRLPQPGRYRVVLHYWNDPSRGLPSGQVDPAVLARVRSSERLLLASRPIVVNVR